MTRREREVTDIAEILRILDASKVLHLGLCDDGQPYVVPMNYGYIYENGALTVYLHGAKKGYKYDVLAKNPRVSFALECDVVPFGGDVACKYGTSYSCVMGKGTAEIVSDSAEKRRALSVVMKTQTGKDFEFDDKLAGVVGIIRITVSEFTAKKRPLPV
ncbi:MAG: pyridoxamine 5'-phosphate oxidase family protein [Eubacteriales bacterium]|nr:pyridoxamine 5'-phosphate oxidase family protein [Eubacteriales bacterium]MDD3883066.1 pyridoxamine 5'-phosphate oxidase family protein [Eubacteriales bacterium]MDD4513617.1 pyridoxamine 5'-phosphate oxidase family protein [Eubacteriales bacterium]